MNTIPVKQCNKVAKAVSLTKLVFKTKILNLKRE